MMGTVSKEVFALSVAYLVMIPIITYSVLETDRHIRLRWAIMTALVWPILTVIVAPIGIAVSAAKIWRTIRSRPL